MVKLDLQSNEGIILQRENVRRKMQKGTSLGDLVLTNINQILGGEPLETASGKNIMAIPGTKELAGTLKDTVGVFKDTLGVKSKKSTVFENITCKCIGCMAPLSGVKGSTVRCKYCDTEQTL